MNPFIIHSNLESTKTVYFSSDMYANVSRQLIFPRSVPKVIITRVFVSEANTFSNREIILSFKKLRDFCLSLMWLESTDFPLSCIFRGNR